MPTFGQRSRFAFVTPERKEDADPRFRDVDIYAAGRWITCDDSIAFVPQFAFSMMKELRGLLEDDPARRFALPFPEFSPQENHVRVLEVSNSGKVDLHSSRQFMYWGPTTDSVIGHLFVSGETAYITFEFPREQHHDPTERGKVFVAELPVRELILVMHDAAYALALGH